MNLPAERARARRLEASGETGAPDHRIPNPGAGARRATDSKLVPQRFEQGTLRKDDSGQHGLFGPAENLIW